ncbi:MAG: response regulator [Candidatus Rokubacteria bacterium]|nr:response regulator [Candidatus Rokubacteria bacterium]
MSERRKKILVVDDAGPVVVLCVNVLQALGYAVQGANNGEVALGHLERETFDLVIVDYKMPGMSGFQVLERARERHPDIASVLVTGHGTPEVMKEAAKHSFDAILLKPFTSNELRTTVDQVLRGRS